MHVSWPYHTVPWGHFCAWLPQKSLARKRLDYELFIMEERLRNYCPWMDGSIHKCFYHFLYLDQELTLFFWLINSLLPSCCNSLKALYPLLPFLNSSKSICSSLLCCIFLSHHSANMIQLTTCLIHVMLEAQVCISIYLSFWKG